MSELLCELIYKRTIARFRRAVKAAARMTAERYPRNSQVTVKLGTITVTGIVHAQVASCPDRIAVLLENGNVWDYPVEDVSPR